MTSDFESTLLGAIVGSGLGVLGAYVFDLRKEGRARAAHDNLAQRERTELRATVATAILTDLREAESLFRQLYDAEKPSMALVARPRFYFDELKADTRWFSPVSIGPIAEFYRLAGMYLESHRLLREAGGGRIASSPEREHDLRTQAGFVLQALPAAKDALLSEGATLHDPKPTWTSVTFPKLPAIPDPVFETTKTWLEQRERNSRPK